MNNMFALHKPKVVLLSHVSNVTGYILPYKEIFDIGIATRTAIINYGKGVAPLECGGKSEYDNGNGSLMRILPVALRYNKQLFSNEIDGADIVFNVSALSFSYFSACLLLFSVAAFT